jgi:hypothetical protein
MTIALTSICIIGFLFVSLLIARRYKDKIKRKDLTVWVDISTILIAFASLIVSGVSISVMLSQEKTEKFLLEAQMKEHQPIFSINYTVTKSEASQWYDMENFVIENIGEQMLSPAKISHKTFIKIDYENFADNTKKSVYYPLISYYRTTIISESQVGVLSRSYANEYTQNYLKFRELDMAVQTYNIEHDNEYIVIEKVDLFKITYTDIYNEERTCHYRNSYLCSPEIYTGILENAASVCELPGEKEITNVCLEDILTAVKGK